MSVFHFKPAKMTVNITRASKVNRMLIKHLFSPFDGCEQVNLLKMFRREIILSEHSLLVLSFPSVRRRNQRNLISVNDNCRNDYKRCLTFCYLKSAYLRRFFINMR